MGMCGRIRLRNDLISFIDHANISVSDHARLNPCLANIGKPADVPAAKVLSWTRTIRIATALLVVAI